jgi:hypothetical protein
VLEAPISARAERIEQNPVQRVVVVGVEVAAFGRVLAARIALCPGEKEIVDRRADDITALFHVVLSRPVGLSAVIQSGVARISRGMPRCLRPSMH